MRRPLVLAHVLLLASFATAAPAQTSPTLRKIEASGVVSIGYRDSSVPFSYLDDRQRPVGYSMALCDRIVDAIKRRLGVQHLERRLVPVNSATRIPLVANGSVDLECGVTTNTLERQRQVSFSLTTFVAASRLASRRQAPVMRLEDLRERTVTSTVGTTSLRHLQELYTKGLPMRIVAARDDPDAFRLLESGRVSAYAMDDVLLYGTIAGSSRPQDFVVSDEALSVEPYAIMLPKDDVEFKRLVDSALVELLRSGEILTLYRRWFQSPIPPHGTQLGMPMSAAMKRIVERPTDSADPAQYR